MVRFDNLRFFLLGDSHSTGKGVAFLLPPTWRFLWKNNDTNYFELAVVLKISISLKGRRKSKGKPALLVLAPRLSWEESTSSALWIQRSCSQLSGWAPVKAVAHGAFLMFSFVLLGKNCQWSHPCIQYPAIQRRFSLMYFLFICEYIGIYYLQKKINLGKDKGSVAVSFKLIVKLSLRILFFLNQLLICTFLPPTGFAFQYMSHKK